MEGNKEGHKEGYKGGHKEGTHGIHQKLNAKQWFHNGTIHGRITYSGLRTTDVRKNAYSAEVSLITFLYYFGSF